MIYSGFIAYSRIHDKDGKFKVNSRKEYLIYSLLAKHHVNSWFIREKKVSHSKFAKKLIHSKFTKKVNSLFITEKR